MRRHGALAAQRIALLDTEAVLFVDDHEGEVEEVDVVLQQRVGADHDAGVAADDVEQGAAALGGRLAAGEQRNPGAVLGTSQHAALGEVAEHGGDGAVVLGREHLGRGEQRGLAAGVDGGEHRAQRDHGLAGADLTLQQPVHRHVATQLLGDGRPHLALTGGEGEGKTRVEGLEQPARTFRPRGRDLARRRAPALREGHLQDERLLVAQPTSGRLDLGHRVGRVDAAQRVGARHQSSPVAHGGREGIGHVVEHVEHPPHTLGDGPRVQRADRAVDGDQGLALARVEVLSIA